jgi:alpha-galactosidase
MRSADDNTLSLGYQKCVIASIWGKFTQWVGMYPSVLKKGKNMMRMQGMLYRRSLTIFFVALLLSISLFAVNGQNTNVAHAENNGLVATPFMGWSTWSYVGTDPTEAKVEAQARVEASKLKAYGYNYVLLDDWYYLNPATNVDQYGRWVIDSSKFPHGIAAVANYVHSLGLKFGFYLTPGIPVAAVNQNTPIEGTSYHAKDIANTSKAEINYNFGGGTKHTVMYYIDYSKPGAQAFINSWADQLASWGVDFLKVDGVGSFDIPDVLAWDTALKQSGRPIVYDLSNELNINDIATWRVHANAWRIDGDVECYNCGSKLTSWPHVATRFTDAPKWVPYNGPHGWNDLDALQISDGALNGLTNDERQSYMTLWAIEAAPLYAGDDLTTMDSYGLSLLTNKEVIAVDQAGRAASPVSQSSNQQVWFVKNSNGSYSVALFNLGSSAATVTANWSSLGLSGSQSVRDLWSHTNLGNFNGSFSAKLNSHASRMLTVG